MRSLHLPISPSPHHSVTPLRPLLLFRHSLTSTKHAAMHSKNILNINSCIRNSALWAQALDNLMPSFHLWTLELPLRWTAPTYCLCGVLRNIWMNPFRADNSIRWGRRGVVWSRYRWSESIVEGLQRPLNYRLAFIMALLYSFDSGVSCLWSSTANKDITLCDFRFWQLTTEARIPSLSDSLSLSPSCSLPCVFMWVLENQ